MTDDYAIITFDNTHHAIASEQRLIALGFWVRIIPVPTQVTANCGLAVRFQPEEYGRIFPLLEDFSDTSYYTVHIEGRKKAVLPLKK